jgi:hypothetical protein
MKINMHYRSSIMVMNWDYLGLQWVSANWETFLHLQVWRYFVNYILASYV